MASDEEKILSTLDTEGFQFFDQKGLGTVTPDDISNAVERARIHLPAPEFQGLPEGPDWKTDLEMMIAEFDGDLDGRLTHGEFKAFIDKSNISENKNIETSLVTKQLKEVFDMFDTDKDGFINEKDLKTVMDCMEGEETDGDDVADMINKVSSQEGTVSFEDFLGIFKQTDTGNENIEDLILNQYDDL